MKQYAATDLAILVPTKDRPHKIRTLLETLCAQTTPPGRIIIVDGGQSVAAVVAGFADALPVEHHVCLPPGQIRQRNLGISLLDARTPLVALLDDDIELEPTAIAEMIAFWNRADDRTAAVSFNITNTPPEPNTWLRRAFFLAGDRPGRVLASGLCTSSCQVSRDWPVEWVCGGATVWKADVLRAHPHRELPGKWAIAEDIVYSVPIARTLPMFVCAAARVRHVHVFDYSVKRPDWFHGYTQTLWLCHFVESNAQLSKLAFVWMTLGTSAARLAAGLAPRGGRHARFAMGQLTALYRVAAAVARGKRAADVIANDHQPR